MGKSISNNYRQKLLDSAKKSTMDAIKAASKRAIQKIMEAIGDLIGNKIAAKITSLSTELHSEKSNNNNNNNNGDVEIPAHKKRYISPEGRQQIIDELRLVPKRYVWIKMHIAEER